MPPTPYHQPHLQQNTSPNLSVLSTFTAALSDLSTLKPTLLTLRHDYLSLDRELLRATSQIEDLERKNERLERGNERMRRECDAIYAGRMNYQNERFMEDLSRQSGISFEGFAAADDAAVDSPMWLDAAAAAAAAAAGRDGVVGEVWKREGRFIWVRREDGGMGRIDGVAGVTRERVVGGWESWKKGLGRRVGEKRKGWRTRLADKRESWVGDLRERWREEKARIRGGWR